MATLVAAWGSACFPDPPRVEETSEDTDAVADTVASETSAGDVVPVDTSDADAGDPDTAVTDTRPADTGTTDTALAETSTPDAEIADTSEPDTAAPDVEVAEEVIVPECDEPGDCEHLTATCVEGACEDGACVARALSGTGCDDGDLCTSADRCEAGRCGGTPVVCTALDQCHDVGVCDSQTGECSNPVLSEVACDDGDRCTQGDACTGGVCTGTAVECVAKDQCHEVGVCNPDTGMCTDPVKEDGVGCDDGLKCTEGDVCAAGVCGGSPVVCVALDQCHLAGVCDPGTGVCSNPAKANGTPCDDLDSCTRGDVCSSGFCFGPNDPPRQDFNFGLVTDGRGGITAVGPLSNGGARVVFGVRGTEVTAQGSSTYTLAEDAANGLCAVYLAELAPDGSVSRVDEWARGTTCSYSVRLGIMRLQPLGDSTMIAMGRFEEPFTTTPGGRTIGVSPTGLILTSGNFLARLREDGAPIWVVTFLGYDMAFDGFDFPSLYVGAGNESILAVNLGDADSVREIVRDSDDSELVAEPVDGNVGVIYRVSATGVASEFARFSGDPAQLAIRGVFATKDGTILAHGFSTGGSTNITTATDSAAIPTGIAGQWEGWVVAFDPDAHIKWSRHFFVAPGGGVDSRDLPVLPAAMVADDSSTWVALSSDRFVRSRTDGGGGELLGSDTEAAHPGLATLVLLSTASGDLVSVQLLGSAKTYVAAMAMDSRGPAIVGRSIGTTVDVATVGNGVDYRPFLLRPTVWGARVAEPAAGQAAILGGGEEAFFDPRVSVDSTGGFYVLGMVSGAAWVGDGVTALVNPPTGGSASYLVRIGSNAWRDCQ